MEDPPATLHDAVSQTSAGFLMLRGFSRIGGLLSVFSCVLTLASSAGAVTLTFEGLKQQENVEFFYDPQPDGMGGFVGGSLGSIGPNFGVVISGATAFLEGQSGSTFANEPSPVTIISSVVPLLITGAVADGFTGAFSVSYTNNEPLNVETDTLIRLFASLDGTGVPLATLTLLGTGGSGFTVWNGANL